MSRLLLSLALLAFSCDAFVVQPAASVALRTPAVSALEPVMMAAKKPVKKVVKKPVKKVVKKPVKKVVKKPVKKVVKKAVPKKAAARLAPGATPNQTGGTLTQDFFSERNWGVQAVKELGVSPAGLGGVAIWILLVLRFTIFYGAFGDAGDF